MVLKGIKYLTAFFVQLRLARRTALEAAMGPEVLLRTLTQDALDPLIDPQAIGFFGLAGEMIERCMDHQTITAAICQALLGKRHHQRLAQSRKLAGGGDRCGLNPEQRHKNTLLGAVVLI